MTRVPGSLLVGDHIISTSLQYRWSGSSQEGRDMSRFCKTEGASAKEKFDLASSLYFFGSLPSLSLAKLTVEISFEE